MAEERLGILDALFAANSDPELLAVRDQAYRNAFVLAAAVVSPGFNGVGERYFVLDRHARSVSSRAGDNSSEARLASAQQQLLVQERRIDELEREVQGLRKGLLEGRPLSRLAYEGASQILRPLARRIRRSESGVS